VVTGLVDYLAELHSDRTDIRLLPVTLFSMGSHGPMPTIAAMPDPDPITGFLNVAVSFTQLSSFNDKIKCAV
jgi:hypothetical protein